jgi:hypothetical protein
LDWWSARPRPHNHARRQKEQGTGSRNASISQAGLEFSVTTVEDLLFSNVKISYIDIYIFKFLVALMSFLCFIKTKLVVFIRINVVQIRTENSDFHRVIPCPNRKTRLQGGEKCSHNLQADLRMYLPLAACSDIKKDNPLSRTERKEMPIGTMSSAR